MWSQDGKEHEETEMEKKTPKIHAVWLIWSQERVEKREGSFKKRKRKEKQEHGGSPVPRPQKDTL